MKTVLWLLGEIIFFCVLSYACKKIRNFRFYYGVLEHTKYPLFDFVSFKEKIVYSITKLVIDAPTFSFAPSDYEFWRRESEKEDYCSRGEKNLINLSLLFLYLRSVIGNILIDVVLVITYLTCRKIIDWEKVWEFIKKIASGVSIEDIGKLFGDCLCWVQENVNVFLVILIVVISCYLGFLKRKKRRYIIEAVWAEEDEVRVKKVAKIQKSIEKKLLEIRGDIYQNLVILQREIRYCNNENKHDFKLDHLIEYEGKSDEIKTLLWEIVESEGISVYAKRNGRMYLQLTLLGLLPSATEKKVFIELDRLSKKNLERKCKSKEQLCEVYAYGVGLMNGINRFLEFSYKKRKQYNKIVLHIADSDYVGRIFEKVK